MDHKNVIDLSGVIHEGLFNTHTGFLIDLNCGGTRFDVVHPYEQLVPGAITEAPVSCHGCKQVAMEPLAHTSLENVTRAHAAAVLTLADNHGRVPELDGEGLRLAFAKLEPASRPSAVLYPVIREHLVEELTERALAKPDGVPEVLVEYPRYTGGTVQAPIGVGDRLMRNGVASGIWTIVEVAGIEETRGGIVVSLRELDGWVQKWPAGSVTRCLLKLDRAVEV